LKKKKKFVSVQQTHEPVGVFSQQGRSQQALRGAILVAQAERERQRLGLALIDRVDGRDVDHLLVQLPPQVLDLLQLSQLVLQMGLRQLRALVAVQCQLLVVVRVGERLGDRGERVLVR